MAFQGAQAGRAAGPSSASFTEPPPGLGPWLARGVNQQHEQEGRPGTVGADTGFAGKHSFIHSTFIHPIFIEH